MSITKLSEYHRFYNDFVSQHAESDHRQHDVAAIYPMHLAMKSRQRAQFLAPVQTKGNQRRRNEKAELSDAGKED